MKYKVGVFFLLLVLFTVPAQVTYGQFWKKLFGKEEERPKKKPAVKPRAADNASKPKKKKNIDYPVSKIKERYRVDVLVPLYLDELVVNNKPAYKDRVPDKALPGMSFYEGIKLAADTLSNLGYSIDVFVHDITQKGLAPEEMIKKGELKQSDLIIGALQSNNLAVVAEFSQNNNINFISAFSPSDANIRDNPFFTLLQPTLETHCERLKTAMFKQFTDQNIFLFYRTNNGTDSLAYSYIIDSSDEKFNKIRHNFNKILCNVLPQKNQLQRFFDSTKQNVIIMPIVDNVYAEGILQQLSTWFPEYQFSCYGMPTWKLMNTLKKADAYPNIAVNFTSPFYYDISTPAGQLLSSNYKKQFGTKPLEMVFRGYETLYWYAYLLQRYGTVFNTRMSDNKTAAFTRFDIKPQWNKEMELLYNENEHIYLYRYQSGSYLVEQ